MPELLEKNLRFFFPLLSPPVRSWNSITPRTEVSGAGPVSPTVSLQDSGKGRCVSSVAHMVCAPRELGPYNVKTWDLCPHIFLKSTQDCEAERSLLVASPSGSCSMPKRI